LGVTTVVVDVETIVAVATTAEETIEATRATIEVVVDVGEEGVVVVEVEVVEASRNLNVLLRKQFPILL
jgi:uncharacterized protein YuzE